MFSKIKRAFRFMKHTLAQPSWYEDYEFLATIVFSLNEVDRSLSIHEYIPSIQNNLKWIRLAKKLIKMHIEEHYVMSTPSDSSWEDIKLAANKDDRCLKLAMKIIAEKGRGWWI